MKRAIAILSAVLAALAFAGLGAFLLRQYPQMSPLWGVGFIVLGVAIALPIPLHAGVLALKDNIVLIVPVVFDALKGGSRKTDPPALPRAQDDPSLPPPAA